MRSIVELSAVFGDRPQCELRVMCGPRYNAFVPAEERREEPGKFFQRARWKAMRSPIEEDAERWDSME